MPVEKIIHVPVEKIVEVPVEIIVENPVIRERVVEKQIFVDKYTKKPRSSYKEVKEDPNLTNQISMQRNEIQKIQVDIARIKAEIDSYNYAKTNVTLKSNIDYTSQNKVLSERINQL